MNKETIKSVKDYVKESVKAGNPAPSAIEVVAFRFSGCKNASDIHTDNLKSLPAEYFDNLDNLPDNMPVMQFEYMDEDEYSQTVDANCIHIPFSDFLEGDDPHILVVVLPYNWEDYMEYWTVSASTGEVDDAEFNDMGGFCYWKENIGPLFSDIDRVERDLIQHYSSEAEAVAELGKLQKYYQEHIDFNEEVHLVTIRHYMEDGEWFHDDVENDIDIVYQFKDITGDVIVVWAWETHVGYAREFKKIRTVSEFDTCHDESLTVPCDDTYRPQCSILFTKEEADEAIENDTYDEKLEEKLFDGKWKWTNPGFVHWVIENDNH